MAMVATTFAVVILTIVTGLERLLVTHPPPQREKKPADDT